MCKESNFNTHRTYLMMSYLFYFVTPLAVSGAICLPRSIDSIYWT